MDTPAILKLAGCGGWGGEWGDGSWASAVQSLFASITFPGLTCRRTPGIFEEVTCSFCLEVGGEKKTSAFGCLKKPSRSTGEGWDGK